ncbi:MAG: antibiotic biosynthesis monooxygenase [Acidobacteria bacterium]|nr:antibiotic biosynthesis monooxygenase [Acidobacteriota bacterium]
MRQSEAIRFVIEIEVSDIDGFKAAANDMVAISDDEPGTLVYDWYLDEDTGQGRLYEAYASFEALDAHIAGPVFTEVGPRIISTCTFVRMDAFGNAPPERRAGPGIAPTTWWGDPFAAVSAT